MPSKKAWVSPQVLTYGGLENQTRQVDCDPSTKTLGPPSDGCYLADGKPLDDCCS